MKTLVGRKWVVIVALGLCGCKWGKKAPECKVLVASLSELSDRLAQVRNVVSAGEVKPTEVAEALKPFSATAKNVANALNAKVPTVSSLRKVSNEAAAVALTLSKQSAQMAEFAEQMRDVDAASKAVDEDKQQVDALELQIKAICEAEAAKCVELSGALARFPAPTDQTEVSEDVASWTRKLSAWSADLEKVTIQDQELKGRVRSFVKSWQDLGVAMLRLVTMLELGKKYEALSQDFNHHIERANKTIAEANSLCVR